MKTEKKGLSRVEERRRKIEELVRKSPEEIEKVVLPTVSDIYSHADFSRRRKKDHLDREHD